MLYPHCGLWQYFILLWLYTIPLCGCAIICLPTHQVVEPGFPRAPRKPRLLTRLACALQPKVRTSSGLRSCNSITWAEVIGLEAMILVLLMLSFKPAFSLSSFTLIKRLFSSSLFSAIRMVFSAYLRLLIFLSAILISALSLFSKMMSLFNR